MERRRLHLAAWLLLCVNGVSGLRAEDDAAGMKSIRQWVDDLDNDDFRTREAATRRLRAAGRPAFTPLAAAATGPGVEVTLRAFAILREGAASKEPAVAKAAKDALLTVIHSRNKTAAARARGILARDFEQVILLLQHGGVIILREGGDFSGLRLADGWQAGDPLLLLLHFSELPALPAGHPAFGDAQVLLTHLAKIEALNLFESALTDEGLKHLGCFPNLKRIPMGMTKVTDAGLARLKDRTRLVYVGLRGNNITDAGLVHLRDMTHLTGLHLGETKITDAGLAHLKALTQLDRLVLGKTAITDDGLEHLHGLTRLRSLDVSGTKVTPEGIARLREKAKELKLEP